MKGGGMISNIVEILQVISHKLFGLSVDIKHMDNKQEVMEALDVAIRTLCDLKLMLGGNKKPDSHWLRQNDHDGF